VAHRLQQLEVGAEAGAVAVDRSDQEVADAGLGEALDERNRAAAGVLQPAGGADGAVADICGDGGKFG